MKFWAIMAGLVVATVLAGHLSGRWQGEREVLAERQREADELVAKQRAIGESIARLVRESDEIVVVTIGRGDPRETRQVFHDDAWRAKLAGLLVDAPYRPGPVVLCAPTQYLEFKAKGLLRLTCRWSGGPYGFYGDGISGGAGLNSGGLFFVGDALTNELEAWMHAKVPLDHEGK